VLEPAKRSPANAKELTTSIDQGRAHRNEIVAELRAMTRPEQRLDQVLRWVVEGSTTLEIADTIAAAWPDAEPAALLIEATRNLEEAGAIDPVLVMGFCHQATLQLYKDMRAIGDFAGALAALKSLAKLHQLS
jgi:hypothetical protein